MSMIQVTFCVPTIQVTKLCANDPSDTLCVPTIQVTRYVAMIQVTRYVATIQVAKHAHASTQHTTSMTAVLMKHSISN